jgi:Icc protein
LREAVETVLLFVHHPPLLCGCQFMDSHYPLQNREEVWTQLQCLPAIEHIFCGHYHTDTTVVRDGKQIHVTPSTMMQIDRDTPTFAIAHTRPGWRIIEWSTRKVHTYVEYL